MHRVGDRIHYVEARPKERPRFVLSTARLTDHLDRVLQRASRPTPIDVLEDLLMDSDVTRTDAQEYLDSLLNAGLLSSAVEPLTICVDPLKAAIGELNDVPAAAKCVAALEKARTELQNLDAQGVGHPTDRYEAVLSGLASAFGTTSERHCFQVDAFRSLDVAQLSEEIIGEMLAGASLLLQITLPREPLKAFRQRFKERYEEATVPLLDVLDEELGIGFRCDWDSGDPDPRIPILAELVVRAERHHSIDVELTSDDLSRLAAVTNGASRIGHTFMVVGSVSGTKDSIAAGDYRVIVDYVTGPTGVSVFGRFCNGDEPLQRHVREMLRQEEAAYPDVVFAEIAHAPDIGSGNVMSRPALRKYVIPLSGNMSVLGAEVIPLHDLFLRVVDDEVMLVSRTLRKRVVPSLMTAHNYSAAHNLPLYQFLATLQSFARGGTGSWMWGGLRSLPFLPRITHGRLVIAKAKWNVSASDLDLASKSLVSRMKIVSAWRRAHRVPRYAAIEENDNLLTIDFEAVLSVEVFCQILCRNKQITLVERVTGHDDLLVTGPGGRYVSELFVPFRYKQPAPERPASTIRVPSAGYDHSTRMFLPGGEWLYLKLYTGRSLADRAIQQIRPLIGEFHSAGLCDKWFFVRYADPEPHLRLRIHGDPAALCARVLPALESLASDGFRSKVFWRAQVDTYVREVERYGGPAGIELAETVFCLDSNAALELVALPASVWNGDRGFLPLLSMDMLAADLGWSNADRATFYRAQADTASTPTRRQWSQRFRENRSRIEAMLGSASAGSDSAANVILGRRSLAIGQRLSVCSTAELRALREPTFVPSMLHMCFNRLTIGGDHDAEVSAYDSIGRCIRTSLARRAPQ
jgi:thiopeptide-type bacteriocin biosynthesis protein